MLTKEKIDFSLRQTDRQTDRQTEGRLLFTSNFLNGKRGGKHYLTCHLGDVLC